MSTKITKQKAMEICQAIGINPFTETELQLDFQEIEKLSAVSDLDTNSQIILKFDRDSRITATLITKNLTVDITNYDAQP